MGESAPLLRQTAKCLTAYRYVGNTMAAFVMQSLGCDVAALNTVQFSMGASAPSARSDTAYC